MKKKTTIMQWRRCNWNTNNAWRNFKVSTKRNYRLSKEITTDSREKKMRCKAHTRKSANRLCGLKRRILSSYLMILRMSCRQFKIIMIRWRGQLMDLRWSTRKKSINKRLTTIKKSKIWTVTQKKKLIKSMKWSQTSEMTSRAFPDKPKEKKKKLSHTRKRSKEPNKTRTRKKISWKSRWKRFRSLRRISSPFRPSWRRRKVSALLTNSK